MPTCALLGATGSTGAAIVRCLLALPPEKLTLNILVRSRSKLNHLFPDLERMAPFPVKIIEGTPYNVEAMQKCLMDVDVIMACIGTNVSSPGMTIHYDTAGAIVSALEIHRATENATCRSPTIIQLRSISLNSPLKAHMPWLLRTVSDFCLKHLYADMTKNFDLFVSVEEKSPGLLNYILVDPPALHDADGVTPTGFELMVTGVLSPGLNYADLGAAFCEIAERKDEFNGTGVGVSATGTVNETWGVLLGYMFNGAKQRL